jgi:hypothetical protein
METARTIIFAAGEDHFQMDVVRITDPGSPGDGEAQLTMKVRSSGFAGQGSWWTDRAGFETFVRDLASLARTMKGKAELRNQWRTDFALAILPIRSRGHFAVEGEIAATIHGREQAFFHCVRFGFEVELGQIEKAAKQLSTLST